MSPHTQQVDHTSGRRWPLGVASIILTLGGLQLLTAGVNLVRSKMVAVLIGPAGVGLVSVIDQIVTLIAQISAFSLPFAAMKYLSQAHGEDMEQFKARYVAILRLLLVLTSAATLLCIGLILLWPPVLGSRLVAYRPLVIIGLLAAPTMGLRGFLSNVMAAMQNYKASALVALIGAVLLVSTSYVGIRLGDIRGLFVGNLAVGCIMVVGTLWYAHRYLQLPLPHGALGIMGPIRHIPTLLRFCSFMYILSFTNPFAFLIARYTVLKSFGQAEAGFLQAAYAIAACLYLVLVQAIHLYLTPIVNRDIEVGEKMRRTLEFQKNMTILATLAAMLMVLFPKWVLILLFSPSFVPASNYLYLFVLSECILLLAGSYHTLLIGLDDLKTYLMVSLIAHTGIAVLSFSLVPHLGVWGVAIACCSANLVAFLLSLARLIYTHGFAIPWRLVLLTVYSLSALTVSGFLSRGSADVVGEVVVKVPLYLGFAASFWFFLSRDERAALFRLWTKVGLKTA